MHPLWTVQLIMYEVKDEVYICVVYSYFKNNLNSRSTYQLFLSGAFEEITQSGRRGDFDPGLTPACGSLLRVVLPLLYLCLPAVLSKKSNKTYHTVFISRWELVLSSREWFHLTIRRTCARLKVKLFKQYIT